MLCCNHGKNSWLRFEIGLNKKDWFEMDRKAKLTLVLWLLSFAFIQTNSHPSTIRILCRLKINNQCPYWRMCFSKFTYHCWQTYRQSWSPAAPPNTGKMPIPWSFWLTHVTWPSYARLSGPKSYSNKHKQNWKITWTQSNHLLEITKHKILSLDTPIIDPWRLTN